MNGFIKKTLIFVSVMAAVGAVGWVGRKAYKKAAEHRMVSEAGAYLAKNDLRNAALCLQRALQLNPMSAPASKLTADMLEAAGTPAALSWRIRAFQLQTNNVDYRFAWAETALKFQEPRSAAQALSGLDGKMRATAAFHKMAGALAWDARDAVDAEQEYQEASRLEPTNQTTILNLATIQMASTNKAVAERARKTLEGIPTNSPVGGIALRFLASDAVAQQSYDRALTFSKALLAQPSVAYSDKLGHLQILRAAKSPEFGAWLATLEESARHTPNEAYALGRWMAVAENPTNALRWLQKLPAAEQTNMPVPLIVVDCEIATRDWKGLRAVVEKKNWEDLEFFRLAVEALADRELNDTLGARTCWDRAFGLSARRLDRLSKLSQVAVAWGWNHELTQTLQKIVADFPKEQWALNELISCFYANGDTTSLAELLARTYSANPADNHLKNDLASVEMLRKADLGNAYRLAREAYDSSPENPFFISTYSYSLLLQHRPEDAVKILAGLKAEHLKNPSIAAYYGIVQAQTGHKEVAREPLKLAEGARLLPEEKEMVRTAIARL